jgi:hypothetical protein
MSRFALIALLSGAAALGDASAASAADAMLKDKLAPKIQDSCHSGRITAGDLGRAIYESGAIPLTQEFGWLADAPAAISKAAFDESSTTNKVPLAALRRLAETWSDPGDPSGVNFLPLAEGGVEIRWRDGKRMVAPAGPQAALQDILAARDERFDFFCKNAAPGPSQPQAPTTKKKSRVTIAIAEAPDDLALPLSKKSFAQIAYINDMAKDEKSISIYATVGASFGELTPIRRDPVSDEGVLLRVIPSMFVQLERDGLGDGSNGSKVNNLNFGGNVSGFIQPRYARTWNIYYSLAARYLTDTEFDSSAWAADFSLTPQLPLPGSLIAYDIVPERLVLDWMLTGAADYHHVSDPGDKEELVGKPNFFRAGFDLEGSLRFLLDDTREHAIALTGAYKLREAFGKSVGDAHWLSIGLMVEPTPFYSFGLSFERGRNLDSLEYSKKLMATFGIRR